MIHRIYTILKKSNNPLITFLKKFRRRFFLKMKDYPSKFIGLKNISNVHFSQFGQDVFVGDILCQKKKGFFVDVGAREGLINSNTFYLENDLNWDGLLIEPHPDLYDQLSIKRKTKRINCACSNIEGVSKFVKFLEEPLGNSGLLNTFQNKNRLSSIKHEIIDVPTKNLTKILDENSAPKKIDYLDIDTEGHEEEVLYSIDFDKYEFRAIGIECPLKTSKFLRIRSFLKLKSYFPFLCLGSDIIFIKN